MDGWVSRCIAEEMDEWLDGWEKWVEEWMDGGIRGGQVAKRVVGQMDG